MIVKFSVMIHFLQNNNLFIKHLLPQTKAIKAYEDVSLKFWRKLDKGVTVYFDKLCPFPSKINEHWGTSVTQDI